MLLVVLFVFVLVATYLFRHVHHSKLRSHHDVAGFIYANIGILYGILLAFVVIEAYEGHKEAEQLVQNEATHIANLFRSAELFPEGVRKNIRSEIISFTKQITEQEWPEMASGQISENSQIYYHKIWKAFYAFTPVTEQQKYWYQQSLSELNAFADAHRARQMSAHSELPTFMWVVLVLGGVITIAFSFLFGTETLWAKLTMVSSLTLIIGLIFWLIYALSHPYSGIIAISPEFVETQIKHLSSML